jgi:C-terminal processing protease CtpA/Prc
MVFGLVRLSEGSSEIFGYVRYVLPDSDAKTKGIKRGDIFSHVNGVKLSDTNYLGLLFSNAPSYTMGLATISNSQITTTGESVALNNSQQTEQSVHIAKVIEYDGKKVGYLMYNGFIEPQEDNLRAAFTTFSAAQIDELVVDLRYNSGGRVSTAQLMAGLIAGEHGDKVFGRLIYSEKRSAQNSEISITNTDIRLGLSRVFFLTTKSAASASEMIINGLKPYMNVIQIGDKTAGKDVGSNPFLDIIDDKGTVNPNHAYLLLPITFKYYNSDGIGDYSDGLTPTIMLPETLSNLGLLGDVNEPLLKKALDVISGRVIATNSFSTNNKLPFSEIQMKEGRAIYSPSN